MFTETIKNNIHVETYARICRQTCRTEFDNSSCQISCFVAPKDDLRAKKMGAIREFHLACESSADAATPEVAIERKKLGRKTIGKMMKKMMKAKGLR